MTHAYNRFKHYLNIYNKNRSTLSSLQPLLTIWHVSFQSCFYTWTCIGLSVYRSVTLSHLTDSALHESKNYPIHLCTQCLAPCWYKQVLNKYLINQWLELKQQRSRNSQEPWWGLQGQEEADVSILTCAYIHVRFGRGKGTNAIRTYSSTWPMVSHHWDTEAQKHI